MRAVAVKRGTQKSFGVTHNRQIGKLQLEMYGIMLETFHSFIYLRRQHKTIIFNIYNDYIEAMEKTKQAVDGPMMIVTSIN